MKLVIVESPAKAKTINKYLGDGYQVLASFGHVRDLPAKDGSVRPENEFSMDWEVEGRGAQRLKEIALALKGAEKLILATDPDREGEAISWHIVEALKARRALGKLPVERVAFNEITKRAVLEAVAHPRQIDQELVDAYLARRALDYLVGFTLSPVLWRKLPGSRSAGRVQSVALRLICEREAEIEAFRAREYWTVEATFQTTDGKSFVARLTHLDGKKLDKFDLAHEADAKSAVAKVLSGAPYRVGAVERKSVKRHPFPPFTTSTLQQEASRKLGMGASQAMRVAQRLYEGVNIGGETVGVITYMRTDGVQLSGEAIAGSRRLIESDFGADYLPNSPRVYKSQAKNAQEAHEAIRPTDLFRRPNQMRKFLREDEAKLYELIWKRTLASQMESAELDQVAIDVDGANGAARLRATGSVVRFPGFLALYQEDRDDPLEDDDSERRLPNLVAGADLTAGSIAPEQHFTQAPPRYSEASLIKRLEELGIGRPSTYTSILQTLEDREYVKLDKRRLVPEDRGRLVTAFLTSFFLRYVEYGFTADLEEKLDDISGGKARWKDVLTDFWMDFSRLHQPANDPGLNLPSMSDAVAFLDSGIGTRSKVIDALNDILAPHFFPSDGSEKNPRLCPSCGKGELGIKLAKNGPFIGCSAYPECRHTRPLAVANANEPNQAGPRVLGSDPALGGEISVRKGPFGFYVQAGAADDKGQKPKRVSLLKSMDPETVDLTTAVALLALPRDLGKHPETGEKISAGIGRFGPYLKHGSAFRSLGKDDDVLTIGLNRAVSVLGEPAKGRGGRAPAPPGRVLGQHPDDNMPVTLHEGRYGPYVKHGKINATLPKELTPATVTMEQALDLLQARAQRGGAKPARKAAKKQAAKPKAAGATETSKAPGRKPSIRRK
jgi:DNA topoisomerase-1